MWRSPLIGEGILPYPDVIDRPNSRIILMKLCIDAKRCQTTIKLVCPQPSDPFLDLFGRFVPSRPDFEIPRGFAPLTAIDFFLDDARLRGPEGFGLRVFEGGS